MRLLVSASESYKQAKKFRLNSSLKTATDG